MTTRTEHLESCKKRALADLATEDPKIIGNVLVTFFQDLGKHAGTADHTGIERGISLLCAGKILTKNDATKFINECR